MTFGSLFSGIGGMDLGLERAGLECRWQVENEPYCQRVLAKHWPNVTRYGDIHGVEWEEVEQVDLVCGGFPCQPVSVAGSQLAQEDERWLWPEFVRCLRVVRPRFVLVENVPGLLHHGMGDVLGGLSESGYDAEWQVIPAALLGAPHFRARVFLLGTSHNLEHSMRQRLQGLYHAVWGERLQSVAGDLARHVWSSSPRVCGRNPRIPSRVDRLRGLGNAVVPQVAEWVGNRLMEASKP